ncbi:hypothetical protein JOB18_022677 [Solea senegalensis]|uniref:Secreted protein n=1 Tax=Solea senegalensis TaxID=28829 RepID=A0AAV6Q7X0_SOLSE|nr:hypothetical protein JOB18_022677 [Solea senegalensis]
MGSPLTVLKKAIFWRCCRFFPSVELLYLVWTARACVCELRGTLMSHQICPHGENAAQPDKSHRSEPTPHVSTVRRLLNRRDNHRRVPALLL